MSYAQSRANLETSIQNKNFIPQLIREYSASNGYDPEAFYKENVSEEGALIMPSSLEEWQSRPFNENFSKRLDSLYRELLLHQ